MITGKPLLTVNQIQERVRELARDISADYRDSEGLLAIVLLKGAFMFASDLLRHIEIPLTIDFMIASSYARDESTGEVDIHSDIRQNIRGRDVLLIEDIVDTGVTLNYVRERYLQRSPRSLKVCTLLDKTCRRTVDVPIEYRGFEIEDHFVVGYGLDYDNRYRNLPYIAIFRNNQEDR